jgi:predicted RNase H-like HicB family nuclease
MHRYLVVIENAGSNYSAYSPDLPGCVTTGANPEEIKRNMAEAIEFHLEGMAADGLPIPEPSALAEYVEVGMPD